MTARLSLRVQPAADAPREAAAALVEFFAEHALPVELLRSFAIAFDEVLANVVAHGAPGGGPEVIELRLSLADGELCAEVEDSGVAFDPLQAPAPDTTLGVEERAVGGLGILLVRRLMDRVEYERRDGRNLLRFAKAVPSR